MASMIDSATLEKPVFDLVSRNMSLLLNLWLLIEPDSAATLERASSAKEIAYDLFQPLFHMRLVMAKLSRPNAHLVYAGYNYRRDFYKMESEWWLWDNDHERILGECEFVGAKGTLEALEELKNVHQGLEWTEVPMQEVEGGHAGLRMALSKNLCLTLTKSPHATCYIFLSRTHFVLASLLPLTRRSPSSTADAFPYLLLLSPPLPLTTPGVLFTTYVLVQRPDEMRRALVDMLGTERYTPLHAALRGKGLELRWPLPEVPMVGGSGELAPGATQTGAGAGAKDKDEGEARGGAKRAADASDEQEEREAKRQKVGDGRAGGEEAEATGSLAEAERLTVYWHYGGRPLPLRTTFRRTSLSLPPSSHSSSPPHTATASLPPVARPAASPPASAPSSSPSAPPPLPPAAAEAQLHLPPLALTSRALTALLTHRGALYVLKTSRTPSERAALLAEAGLLVRAAAAGVAPRVVGVFEEEGEVEKMEREGDRRCALVMHHGGRTLDREFEDLAAQEKTELYALVRRLHLVAKIEHRDLAPRNVLVDLDGRFQLCDFGLAAEHDME
ncbi:hypothetical protein JCM10450v2_007070 [Rhodotorula kratochvilovae]